MLPTSNGSGCSPLPATQISLDPLRSWSETCSEVLGIMKPWVVCVSMCLWVCLYVCLYVSLWVLVCLWLAMHVYRCLCVCLYVSSCVFPCVYVSVCAILVVYMPVWLCVWECICVCLPVSMYSSGSITSADSQRERLTYRSMCTIQSPAWINGTQLSSPL